MINTIEIIKILSMIIMFSCIIIVGLLPLRWNRFRNSKRILSFANAFSGGLFLAVGIIHLMPEAQEKLDNYYKEQGSNAEDHFPFINFLTVACFALILFIEKIAFDNDNHGHHQHHQNRASFADPEANQSQIKSNEYGPPFIENISDHDIKSPIPFTEQQYNACLDNDEEKFKDSIRLQTKAAAKLSYIKSAKNSLLADRKKNAILSRFYSFSNKASTSANLKNVSSWTPYILQIAIGIHATFEGMAIGIQDDLPNCLGISTAVVCHKWAEGLTLGTAFFQAGVDLKTSTLMIAIQATMNPIGIALGWILSSTGFLVTSIFEAISAGTFLYIAAGEVIVEEFNVARYKWQKFSVFLLAIGFVCSIYFIEQIAGD